MKFISQTGNKRKYFTQIFKTITDYGLSDYGMVVEPFAGTASFSFCHEGYIPFVVNDKVPIYMLLFSLLGRISVDEQDVLDNREDEIKKLIDNPYVVSLYSALTDPIWGPKAYYATRELMTKILQFSLINPTESILTLEKYYYYLVKKKKILDKHELSDIEKSYIESTPIIPILLYNKFAFGSVLRVNSYGELNIPCRYKEEECPRPIIFDRESKSLYDFACEVYTASCGAICYGDYSGVLVDHATSVQMPTLFFIDPPYLREEEVISEAIATNILDRFDFEAWKKLLDECRILQNSNPKNYFVFCHSFHKEIIELLGKHCHMFSYEKANTNIATIQTVNKTEGIEYLFILKD